ncbi:hypothetical protein BJG93_02215 [Paraburkholderia sprentiae WSM5005]|uniref:Helix-turn-helix domain-containing protein n=1 Tax=Paraburkholderia sprentiae WSM5005 TaxID=754502 RepID=A0A1I9YDF6_9BURK|nr:hypothetical protein [Paraburkholderia sprentiae]APA84339.1 hypothetical protein BJG93_02215 [Paraburkholderia sprentiae WSM5005]
MDSARCKTVREFCDYYGISKPLYYKLKQQGRAPAELRAGHRTIVTPEAERAWVEANTVPAVADATTA